MDDAWLDERTLNLILAYLNVTCICCCSISLLLFALFYRRDRHELRREEREALLHIAMERYLRNFQSKSHRRRIELTDHLTRHERHNKTI